ncbi:multidrug efflux RND transporter permease subunit [Limobrevibacterium gyesilva]|uniref:Multidrug efflux RND transporter permease subunit n=1 Tax=Limobrevibacterium gyesilva TaxID=2991712 RepID=A0AA42CEI3_9PROT|nr:multidrug efflux RND transporter permease subunit [Limobrevibacterium gyesilva]MCW3476088.1 multidrug efflux RND transporter permease subunit [Limobrevibacterium gyesilva]
MSISTPFIRRPIGTSLLMAAIVLVGVAAYPLLPVAPLPRVEFPTIQVQAKFPGASPETMATAVAQPLERQFAQIAGVAQMTSVSVLGQTSITVQFDLNRGIDAAALDIQSQITAATGQLPRNLPSPPTYYKVNPSDSPILILAVQSDEMPLIEADDYADNILAQQISQIDGVSQVFIGGEQKRAVRVQVDPARLAAMGLTMEDARQTLQTATVNSPKGTINGERRSFTIYANDQLTKAAEYNNLVIAYRNGAPIRVRDIGQAVDAADNLLVAGHQNGKRGVQLIIFKQPDANIIETVDAIKAQLPRLTAAIPPSVHVTEVMDRTQTIRASVEDVQFTLILTVALVVMVIFLFLRNLWATIIPSVTVPIALIGTFAVMYLLNFSLDNLSLMALTIAVGFVVDDAIVMLENIFRHIEDGERPMDAAIKGAGEIGFTIVSISASLIAVFIPLLLMGGIVGRLFREFAMTVSVAVVVSAVVSLTLTPMMCSRFLRHEHGTHGLLYRIIEKFFDGMLAGYRRTLDIALRFQFVTLMVFLATVSVTVYLYVVIPKGFFPEQDNGILLGISQGAEDISFKEMVRRQLALGEVLLRDPDIAAYSSTVGAGVGGQTGNNGRFFVALKPFAERHASAQEIIARLRPELAKVEGAQLFLQAGQDVRVGGRISKTQYQYTLQDADVGELYAWAPKVLNKLRTLPELRDLATDQQNGGTTASITIDRDAAARFGIQPQVIDDTLYDALGQRQVTQYFTQVNTYKLILEVLPEMQGDLSVLDKLYVKSSTGQAVPLSTFVKVDTTKVAPLSISHQSQFPAVTLSFNLAQGVALGQAVDAVNRAMRVLGTPVTLQGTFQGTAQAFQSSLSSQPYLIAAALITVYIILGILYESYILPLTILSTLPSAGVGALLMLMAFGYDLSVIALIGVILLIGIVKKNGIMMVDFAVNAERRDGETPFNAIRQACLLRFRPIMMTTMAALFSGLPLMIGHGAGSELRRPLGFAMVGGLLLSQVLTLYTTPVIYLYLERLQRYLSPRRTARMPTLADKMGATAD